MGQVGEKPARPWLLKCGEHLLGEVSFGYGEMWHNSGTLTPGPDLPLYQPLLDDYRRLDRAYEAASEQYGQDAISDKAMEAATEARDAAAERIDALPLCLVHVETGKVCPIHDFHPEDDHGGVYWRFKHDDADLPREGLRQRTRDFLLGMLIIAALPFAFLYMFGHWAARKCRLIG